MNKSYLTVVGFLLLLAGIISIVLSLVGLNLEVLGFLYSIGSGFAFLIYIIMIMAGAIMMYMSKIKEEIDE
jgi:hypothetical protein